MKLSRLEPEQQKEAATLLAAKEIKMVEEYTTKMEKSAKDFPQKTESQSVHTEVLKKIKNLSNKVHPTKKTQLV